LGRSMATGSWWDVAFDLAGFIPLGGDGAKAARLTAKALDARRALDVASTATTRVFQSTKTAAKQYWDDLVTRNRANYDRAVANCTDQRCRDLAARQKGPQYENIPSSDRGRWSGERGDSTFTPNGGGAPITYTNGFPNFGGHSAANVDIPMTGNRATDRRLAEEQMLATNSGWTPPANHVWHHNENGVTMQLVPRSVHDAALGGATHTGGAALYTGSHQGGF
jgi:A nuclease of the HNH/ENDO VII superfamily with conserved WHH